MNGTATSVAAIVRHQVETARPGTFLWRRDFAGPDRAVETALSRLVAHDEIVRIRRGLYWRGKKTRFGMTRPDPLAAALAVAGPGSGPAGVAAAAVLGLTTQVPSVIEVAVPGKVPEPMKGIRFTARPFTRRECRLRPTEVAVIELMRTPHPIERPWKEVTAKIDDLIEAKTIRPDVISVEITEERNTGARQRWQSLR
jgi:hypothetical protein